MIYRTRFLVWFCLGACSIAAALAFLVVYHPAIAPVARPASASFSVSQVQRGAALAAIGDCTVCHTAAGGLAFAGGRALATPFGTLYSTNITPDETTGIGTWSAAAFRRALRDGVARDGSHLYPALPYEHYTHVNDEDIDAIYAFLMTRKPVRAEAPPNHLMFPLGFRQLLAGWNFLFLHKGPVETEAARTAEWNRGKYLVDGLAHCGGCHTPRNLAGGEEASKAFAGGVAEGWNAPALGRSNPLAARWTEQSLFTYLRTGIDTDHSAAAGPMGPVAHGLSEAPESDVRAISVYIASRMQSDGKATLLVDRADDGAKEHPLGATLFAGACAGCHADGAPMVTQGRPSLTKVGVLQADDPRNTLQVMREGIHPPIGDRGPAMPSFADILNDHQMAEIAAYLRTRFSAQPAWTKFDGAAASARKEALAP